MAAASACIYRQHAAITTPAPSATTNHFTLLASVFMSAISCDGNGSAAPSTTLTNDDSLGEASPDSGASPLYPHTARLLRSALRSAGLNTCWRPLLCSRGAWPRDEITTSVSNTCVQSESAASAAPATTIPRVGTASSRTPLRLAALRLLRRALCSAGLNARLRPEVCSCGHRP